MCEVNSEVREDGELKVLQKHELTVVQIQEKEQEKKGSAKIDDDCCAPFCSPITCGP